MRLSARAPGKVNLSLFLGSAREDGRHRLVTVFESVSLADDLELTTLEDHGRDEVICSGVEGPNLVARALSALRSIGWDAPPVRVEITKRIPIAAGMGGGSADAAATLRIAAELSPGRPEEIAELAAELGSDVPSALVPGLTLGTGAGDLVEPFEPLARHAFVIVPQSIRLSTSDVYAEADRLELARSSAELDERYAGLLAALEPEATLAPELLVNDLQPAAISLCPRIEEALAAVRAAGAEHAFVSGSGPTVAGLFWGDDAADRAAAAAADLPAAVVASPVGAEFGSPRVS